MRISLLGEESNQEQEREGEIEIDVDDLWQHHWDGQLPTSSTRTGTHQQFDGETVTHSSVIQGGVSIIEPLSLLDRARGVGVRHECAKSGEEETQDKKRARERQNLRRI